MSRSGAGRDPAHLVRLRQRVLAAWAASPARFREDANAEEDVALGAYRDRLVVELAQNAADAARRAGVPGRLLLRHEPTRHADPGGGPARLVAANTGVPLDAEAVEALATLRASAKRGDEESVGRYGVGFAAVLAVTDEPAIGWGDGGGVRFSRADTLAAARAVPSLAAELAARADHVPVLRLPWPARVEVPAGYHTAVVLPLRDPAAADLAGRLLADVDAALLLVLPGLAEIVVEGVDGGLRRVLRARRQRDEVVVTVGGHDQRWTLREAAGRIAPGLLADRPAEERAHPTWRVTWAVARGAARGDARGAARGGPVVPPPGVPPVLHAPTPTDEPLALPALLVASFPLDPGRRHVAPGPLTDDLVERAAELYAEHAGALAAAGLDAAGLVPSPVPVGTLDAALRRGVLRALARTPLLPAAGGGELLRPGGAVAVDDADDRLAAALAGVLGGLAAPGWPRQALDAVGVRRLRLADVVDDLAGVSRPAGWWRDVYAALAGADPGELGALPVPLADGRLVRGARGLLLPGGEPDATPLAGLGLRVVHPEAVHPLLHRLGATPASPAAVLADPAVRAAVAAGAEHADPVALADAVLGQLAGSELSAAELPWIADLLLPDEDGGLTRARELVLPGGPADAVLDDVPRVAPALVERWGGAVLGRLGVLWALGLVRLADAALDPDELQELAEADAVADWADEALDLLAPGDVPPVVPELPVVRDLDYVAAGRWPAALLQLAEPPLRDAVVPPVRVLLADGRSADVPSYAAWWLRRNARVDGRPPTALRLAGWDDRLAGLYDDVALDVDAEMLRAVGVRTSLEALLAERGGPDDLLDRLLAREVPADRLRALYAALATVDPARVRVREEVRVPDGAGSRLVPAGDVVVADGPHWLALPWTVPPLAVPARLAPGLADVLDLPMASQRRPGRVGSVGVDARVPDVVRRVLPAAPGAWREHETLVVDGAEVDWWVDPDGAVHAATLDGLAAGLAWAAGRWDARWTVAAVLAEPHRADALLAEEAFSGPLR